MPPDLVSPPPPPPRARRHSLSDDEDRGSRRDDGARDRHRRKRTSRSPDDEREKHRRSHRHRDDDSPARSDDERAPRKRGRDRSREGRRRSKSRSRSKHRHRSRSKDAARDRYERKRRYDDRSTSPRRHHHHRSERRKDRDNASPRHSRRSRHDRHDHRSRSRSPKRRRPSTSPSPPHKRSAKPLPSQEAAYKGSGDGPGDAGEPPVEKQKPNFRQTGLLAREANTVTVAGTNIVLKYNEPPDARKPPARDDWRLFVFKGQDCLQTIELGSRSCWLIGREAAVADMLVEHPSTSKQHAVLQFRHTTRVNEYGDKDAKVRPYLIDLESSNGTMLNGKQIEPTRFVEAMDKDVIKFGSSEREYVLMLAGA